MGTAPTFSKLLDDPSFTAIADAVRRSTVSAQAMKAMKKPDYREIRYGLLADLRRTSSLAPAVFIQCVADFISKYNTENARRREQGKAAPRNITVVELAGFTRLVDEYKPATVGALLAALGSCRKPTEEPEVDGGTDGAEEREPVEDN